MEHIEAIPQESSSEKASNAPAAAPPPWLFAFLVLPAAVYGNGFAGTALSSILRSQDIPLADIANLVALIQLPPMLYFLWSPLVDFWLRRRTWIVVSSAITGLLLLAALQSNRLGSLVPEALLILAQAVSLLTSSACGGLMGAVVPAHQKPKVSGYYQVGNIGFAAIAGGGVIYLYHALPLRLFGIVCSLLVAVPGLLALTIAEPPVVGHGEDFRHVLARIGREFKHTFLKWDAVPVLMMLCAPFCSGAALSLLPGMAPDFGVSTSQVAWVNGLGGGLLTAAGAALVAFIKMPDDIRPVYAIFGIINALTLSILLFGHPRPLTFFLSVVLYAFSIGACYAVFTALVLKLLGVSGKSGGARYSIAVSLGNAPIFYMVVVDGLGARWFGVKGAPAIDMAVSGLTAMGFLIWFWWQRNRGVEVELGLAVEEA
jgi:PAT family beta-lactamase induction signal transducer AmpG